MEPELINVLKGIESALQNISIILSSILVILVGIGVFKKMSK